MSKPLPQDDASAPLFTEQDVLCRTLYKNREQLLEAMIRRIAEQHDIGDISEVLKAVVAREEESSTVITSDVAVPHARLDNLDTARVAVATSAEGIKFRDNAPPVHLIILILAPSHDPSLYLKVAAAAARLIVTPDFAKNAAACETPAALVKFFQRGGMRLPDYVCAADMMIPPVYTLRDTNSVKDAIDLIVRTGLAEIPVVDKEGDLVGVASADAVLRVCIPEYMLWMEDLSSFSNFEPFGTLLRKEGSTWLADIMSDEFASVSVDRPAIAVAEAMARHKAPACYVLDGAKLVGVVTLPHFLNKVFRD